MAQQFTAPKFPIVRPSIYNELRKRVQDYFEKEGKESTGNARLYTKAFVFVGVLLAVFVHVVFFTPAWYFALLECLAMGMAAAGIGFNVMHDGSHGSFSKSAILNKTAAFSLNILGGSAFMWDIKHNQIHHSFTNVDGVDDDIEAGIFLRLAPNQKRYFFHRLQHLYFWALYCILYIFWIFFADYKKYFTSKIGEVPIGKMKWNNHFVFWSGKLLHFVLFVVVPIYVVGFLPWLVGFLVMTFSTGLVISIVFQLAHTVEHTHFPMADEETNKLPDEFAIHQIKTTANFATNSKLVSWLVGGLNFQIEHHLFPKISHVHYPAISKIVKSVCQEFGVEYNEYKTLPQAVVAHIRFLREMGKPSIAA
jgi:linoleoyl-CoA desaturase